MDTRQFYEVRIAECVRDAEAADLPRVRDRALRAQASWQAMLDRFDRGAAAKATNAASSSIGVT